MKQHGPSKHPTITERVRAVMPATTSLLAPCVGWLSFAAYIALVYNFVSA